MRFPQSPHTFKAFVDQPMSFRRILREIALTGLLMGLFAGLSSCGGKDANSQKDTAAPVSQQKRAPQSTGEAPSNPSQSASANGAVATDASGSAGEKPAQVSETGDDSETVEEAAPIANPNSQSTLKIAAATADGKKPSQFKE